MLVCKIGYIYALCFNGVPFYVGQSINPKVRINQHRYNTFDDKNTKDVYVYIRSITNRDSFNSDIRMKILKCCPIRDLRYNEVQVIKFCLRKGAVLYNSCTTSNILKLDLVN